MANDFDKVGKYELLSRMSVGGMAELFLAFLPGPGGFKKFVALKQILPDARNDPEFVKMFLDEARITASLDHPHIGQVFELGRDEASGELYLAMEFIAGQDLSAISKAAARAGLRFPIPIACRVVRDMCLALNAAHAFVDPAGHALPVVHRDVSPKNVMVSYAGHVKVIDFGIAKARGRLVRTQVGQVRGTLSYMAPEQLRDQPVDGRTDLFAAGIVLHELLTGERLYPSDSPASLLQIVQELPVDPGARNSDVSGPLGAVALKALAKAPDDRFQTGKTFARALEEACPKLADEDELSAFMTQLFEAKIATSRALFEAAQQDASPERLSTLVRRMTAVELEPALATPAVPAEAPTLPEVPQAAPTRSDRGEGALKRTEAGEFAAAPRPRSGGISWGWLLTCGVALASVVVLVVALVVGSSDEPTPRQTPAPRQTVSPRPDQLGATRDADTPAPARNLEQANEATGAGLRLLREAKYGPAREKFREALREGPPTSDALLGYGIAEQRLGNFTPAVASMQQALELARAKQAAPMLLALIHYNLACAQSWSDPAAAVASLKAAFALAPQLATDAPMDPDLDNVRTDPGYKRLMLEQQRKGKRAPR